MKIHERLKSKAVDIHIQKMASLTLNGHHYALLPTRARSRPRTHTYGRLRACVSRYGTLRGSSARAVRVTRFAFEVRTFPDDGIAPWHATTDDRLSLAIIFEPFHLERV